MRAPARLDQHLVGRGLARSRAEAQGLIRDGRVTVAGRVVRKPAQVVPPGARVEVTDDGPRWVGRGALKLDHALRLWGPAGLQVDGRRCLDVGASTGGFTEALLRHGAAHVTALDVGHGQLVRALQEDPRVRDLPGTNIRSVPAGALGGAFDVVVADLSFISLALVLPHLVPLVAPAGDLVLLVKPQFEVGRQGLGRGGLVRTAQDRRRALGAVLEAGAGLGLWTRAVAASPVLGTHGNAEYLAWLAAGRPGMMSQADRTARIDELTREEPG